MKNTNLVVTKSLIGQAEDLAKEHEVFNQQYVVAGRAALYGLLQKIMQLSEAFDSSSDKADLIKLMRVELQEKHGIKTQDNSSPDTVLVRYITRADRKTAHVYARAIETTKANGITSDGFIEYVQEQGGIERIRAIGVDPETKSAKQKAEFEAKQHLWEFLRLRSEAPFARFKRPEGVLPGDRGAGSLHYFVAARRGDEYRVLSALDINDELELKLLAPLQHAVEVQLEIDPDALVKLHDSIEAKKLRALSNIEAGEAKCAA